MDFSELWAGLTAALPGVFSSYRARIAALHVQEKPDRTLLTEADLAIEQMIIEIIRDFEPAARVVAEESGTGTWRPGIDEEPEHIWVIDPIDGTAEFVQPDSTEFCSVVCLLERRRPVATLVVAPELGIDGKPIVVLASGSRQSITVNGEAAVCNSALAPAYAASMTRSSGTPTPPHEFALTKAGYTLKTRTTSQTLDMVRTAIDLTGIASQPTRFDLFYRQRQKIWDGLAGLYLGDISGLISTDLDSRSQLPIALDILSQPEPTFASTVMGRPEAVTWFAELARDSRTGAPKSS